MRDKELVDFASYLVARNSYCHRATSMALNNSRLWRPLTGVGYPQSGGSNDRVPEGEAGPQMRELMA